MRKMIKKIYQKHRNGCTVASLAMLLNISYDEALKLLHPNRKPRQRVSGNIETIFDVFIKNKISVQIYNNLKTALGFDTVDIVSITDLKNPALIALYTREESGKNHVVVWDPESKKILDPGRYRNLPVKYYQKRLSFAFELV